jgi:hypothetical protein
VGTRQNEVTGFCAVMRLVLILLAAVFAVGCAAKGTVPNDIFRFKSLQEQRQFEIRARAGDIEAAQRLTDYYFFLQHDNQKALYWARVCASHGNADCAKTVRNLREIIREQQ